MKKLIFVLFLLPLCMVSQSHRIDTLIIQGHKKTKTLFLRQIVEIKQGQLLDSTLLQQEITRLIRLPSIANASFEVITINNEICKVYINVEENYTLIPSANIWTTTNAQFAYKLGLYEFNALGRNIAFGGFYQNNGNDSYGVNLRAPFLFSNKWGLAINYQKWVSEEPLYFDNGVANYEYENKSWEALVLYQHNFLNRFEAGITTFKESYKFLNGLTSDNVPQQLAQNKLLFKLVYNYDNLTYDFQYIDGLKSTLITQYVATESNFQNSFFIAWNDFFYYKRIGEKGNWANRFRVGLSSNEESPFAPFALDNNINLRGVGNIVDRGTGSIVLNTEYRYTLYEKGWFVLQGNVFTDMGAWRKPGGDFSDFRNSDNIYVYPGVGLRFIHKRIFNAVFRIDYGYGITKNASRGIVFGIGQYF
ncbi:MAG: outer membrane protein assembly factor [Cellulophaga sp.]